MLVESDAMGEQYADFLPKFSIVVPQSELVELDTESLPQGTNNRETIPCNLVSENRHRSIGAFEIPIWLSWRNQIADFDMTGAATKLPF